jgi:hypothetical protein
MKKHSYCSSPECQQARRSARKKERYQNYTVYRKKQLERQRLLVMKKRYFATESVDE